MKNNTFRVDCVDTPDDFFALEPYWKSLTKDSNIPIFLAWEWVSTWWQIFGKKRNPWVLTVRDDKDNLIGLAPWMLEKQQVGPLEIRKLKFIGTGIVSPDHLDLITRPEHKDAVQVVIFKELLDRRKEWDLLEFQSISDNSPLLPALSTDNGKLLERDPLICPYTLLPDTWEAFQKNILSSNRRQQSRRYLRKFKKAYPDNFFFHRVDNFSEISSAIDSLIMLHEKRWGTIRKSTPFSQEDFVAFHKKMAAVALEQGWLRFSQLLVNGQVVSAYYCFRFKGTYYDYQSGYDPDWANFRPGQILLAHMMEKAIEEGSKEFDMLRGDHDYKLSWTDNVRVEPHVLYSKTWKSHPWIFGASLFDFARILGRNRLPKPIIRSLERVIAKLGS